MYSNCEAAVSIILEYIKEHLSIESSHNQNFDIRSYERWAAFEICERIMDHPFTDPITTIEDFYLEIIPYGFNDSYNESNNFIFQIAVETAEKILLLLSNEI